MLEMLSVVLQAFLTPVLIYICTQKFYGKLPAWHINSIFQLYEGLIYKVIALRFPINTWYEQPLLTILAQTLSPEILWLHLKYEQLWGFGRMRTIILHLPAGWKLEASHTFHK
jgi:hypothetical protein